MTCSKKRWRRRSFEAIAARVGNMQARWLRLTVRDSRTPTTRTQKLSRRLLRNDRRPCRASRRAAVTSLFIRTPIRSQTNRKFYAPASLLPENVVYREQIRSSAAKPLERNGKFSIYLRMGAMLSLSSKRGLQPPPEGRSHGLTGVHPSASRVRADNGDNPLSLARPPASSSDLCLARVRSRAGFPRAPGFPEFLDS